MNSFSMPGTLPYSSNAKIYIHTYVCLYVYNIYTIYNTYDMMYIIAMLLKDFG